MLRTPFARALCAAATIARASSTVLASGFSHSTCLPASRAAIAISACVSPGVQMSTSATSARSITRRQSVSVLRQPMRSAAAAVAVALRPHSAARSGRSGRSKNRPAVRQACEWAAPMKA
jgi:hypothetical protein